MNDRYLILDCNYLCHRAKYVFGDLSDKNSATGVIYGFLKDLLHLRERFDSNRFIFCWDYGESLREKMLSGYKGNRQKKELTEDELKFEKEFQRQVAKLRDKHLHSIGFRNVIYQDGYEADDIIAMACQHMVPPTEEGIIVTADKDLYQCISTNIHWYSPLRRELITYGTFKRTFGIKPRQWAKVLAIAGCSTDNVKGIFRVGPKTAISFLRGECSPDSKAYENIKQGWKDTVLSNRKLVSLPLKGTKLVDYKIDHVSQEGWNKVTKELGMKSIRHKRIA